MSSQGVDLAGPTGLSFGAADGVVVAGPAEVREHQAVDQQGELPPAGPREGRWSMWVAAATGVSRSRSCPTRVS